MTNTETIESALSNANITISFGESFKSNKGNSKGKMLTRIDGKHYPNRNDEDRSFVQLRGMVCMEDDNPTAILKPVGMFTPLGS
jgi:hypothetical protein|tara:strand:- start:239 stop:490 length:252 start_codon:yes stop_codon:yes gene_type:complete